MPPAHPPKKEIFHAYHCMPSWCMCSPHLAGGRLQPHLHRIPSPALQSKLVQVVVQLAVHHIFLTPLIMHSTEDVAGGAVYHHAKAGSGRGWSQALLLDTFPLQLTACCLTLLRKKGEVQAAVHSAMRQILLSQQHSNMGMNPADRTSPGIVRAPSLHSEADAADCMEGC